MKIKCLCVAQYKKHTNFAKKPKIKKRKKNFKYPIRMVFKQVCVENVHKAVQYGHFYCNGAIQGVKRWGEGEGK